jgi:hypothetical protein
MPTRGRDVEPDFEAFCDCLNRQHVEYVIVGSEAVRDRGECAEQDGAEFSLAYR